MIKDLVLGLEKSKTDVDVLAGRHITPLGRGRPSTLLYFTLTSFNYGSTSKPGLSLDSTFLTDKRGSTQARSEVSSERDSMPSVSRIRSLGNSQLSQTALRVASFSLIGPRTE